MLCVCLLADTGDGSASTAAPATPCTSAPTPGPSQQHDDSPSISGSIAKASISFSELMPTPKIVRKTVKRKKSINYKGNRISKELFSIKCQPTSKVQKGSAQNKDNTVSDQAHTRQVTGKGKAGQGKEKVSKCRGDTIKPKCKNRGMKRKKEIKLTERATKRAKHDDVEPDEAWLCAVCNKDVKLSMTKCVGCENWVHNECVGLESDDDDDFATFMCPDCDD